MDTTATLTQRIPFNALSANTYRNPVNGYEEKIGHAWLWTWLLGGGIYFAIRGVWRHAVAWPFLVISTLGIAWIVYPFLAANILRRHYLRQGWEPVKG
jgi:hypothetical protein